MADDVPVPSEARVRHPRVPERQFGSKLIVARPPDGAPVVLDATAAHIWRRMDGWNTPAAIDRDVAETFPDVPEDERVAARTKILRMLQDDDLLECA
jgi:hypothetical protein